MKKIKIIIHLYIELLENMAMKNYLKLEIFAHQKCLEIMSNRVNQYEHADLALSELKEYKLDCVIMDHTFGNVIHFLI